MREKKIKNVSDLDGASVLSKPEKNSQDFKKPEDSIREVRRTPTYGERYDALDPELRQIVDFAIQMALRKKNTLPEPHFAKGYYSVMRTDGEILRISFDGAEPIVTIRRGTEGVYFPIRDIEDAKRIKVMLDEIPE